MLSDKENKILNQILSGKVQRRKKLAILFMVAVLPIVIIANLTVKNKALSIMTEAGGEEYSTTNKLETKTELEKHLKFNLIIMYKEYEKMVKTIINERFLSKMAFFGFAIFFLILHFWASSKWEKIIKHLHEEKETKTKGG